MTYVKASDNRELVNWARLVKSNTELAYMREAGALSTRVMNQALTNLAPGKPQKDVISESFVVTESAGERLCAVDRGLFVVA